MNDSIQTMVSELKPFNNIGSFKKYSLKWATVTFAMAIISLLVLPVREDITTQLGIGIYFFDSLLWLALSLAGGAGLYYNSFPEISTKKLFFFPFAILSILLVSSLSQEVSHPNTLIGEMDLMRGRCGFLISFIAIIHGAFLFKFAKRGAPSIPAYSGIWAALSASAMGCFFMQIVCAHHNSFHLLVWHFTPLAVMCSVGVLTAKRLLKW